MIIALVQLLRPVVSPASASDRIVRLTVMCVAAGIVGLLICGWWDYPVSAWVALFLYVTFYFLLLKIAPGSALALLPAFGGVALTQFISGILIESGGYLSETKEMGSATGGFLRLAIVYILFFGTAAVVIEPYIEKWRRNGQLEKFVSNGVRPYMPLAWILDAAFFIGMTYLTYVGFKNGFPLITGEDRYEFYTRLGDPVFISLLGNRNSIAVYLGVMLAIAPKQWRYRFMALYLLVSAAFLGGKFTEFVFFVGQLAYPSLCRLAWSKRGLPFHKILSIGLIITCITMPLVFNMYGGLSNSSTGVERMIDRMTLQGQLWFLADREVKDLFKFEESPIIGEAYMMLMSPDPTPYAAHNKPFPYQGMAYLMLHFAPPSEAYHGLEANVVYCMGLHAYFLEILGWGGLFILNFVYAWLVGLILAGTLYGFVYGRLVYLLFFAKFLSFWTSASMAADPFMLVNWKSFLFLLGLWLYYALDKKFNISAFGKELKP